MDDYAFHKKDSLRKKLQEHNSHVGLIPGGNMCLIPPCDVGVMKSFKSGIRKKIWNGQCRSTKILYHVDKRVLGLYVS